jgi:hypothetical protein
VPLGSDKTEATRPLGSAGVILARRTWVTSPAGIKQDSPARIAQSRGQKEHAVEFFGNLTNNVESLIAWFVVWLKHDALTET